MSRVLPYNAKQWEIPFLLDGRKTVKRRVVKPRYQKNEYGFEVVTNKATGQRWVNAVDDEGFTHREILPPYQPGDILYVRETWAHIPCIECNMGSTFHIQCKENPVDYDDGNSIAEGCFIYRASYPYPQRICWHPSIHMPKEAARIWLKVTDVRVERLQEIEAKSVYAEGALAEVPLICEKINNPENFDKWNEDKKSDWFRPTAIARVIANIELENRLIEKFHKIWDSTLKKSDLSRYGWEANPWVWVIEFERCRKPGENL